MYSPWGNISLSPKVLLKKIFFIQLKLQRRMQYEKSENKGQSVAVN